MKGILKIAYKLLVNDKGKFAALLIGKSPINCQERGTRKPRTTAPVHRGRRNRKARCWLCGSKGRKKRMPPCNRADTG